MPRLVDKLIRDHVRYTGDGLPNEPANAPLPVGDPSSGVYNPTKRDIRESIGDVEGDRILAEAASALAVQAMTDVQGATMFAASRDALLANTASNIPAGAVFATRAEGFVFEVVTTGEDATTAGGVKLRVKEVGGVFNVRAFGAKGDGIAVDTVAVQAALNAAVAAGRVVYFPPGVYLCGTLTHPSGVEMRGVQGRSIIKARADLATTQPLVTNGGAAFVDADMILDGMTFDGSDLGKNSATQDRLVALLRYTKVVGLTARNCVFRDYGYILLSGRSCQNVLVECSEVRGAGYNGATANGGSAMWFNQTDGSLCRNIRIMHCHVHDNEWHGSHVGGIGIIIQGNVYENNKENHVFCTMLRGGANPALTTRDINIVGNTFRNVTKKDISSHGLEIQTWGGVIANNIIATCDHGGISLSRSRDVVISGNQIKQFGLIGSVFGGIDIYNTGTGGSQTANIEINGNVIGMDDETGLDVAGIRSIQVAGGTAPMYLSIHDNNLTGAIFRAGKIVKATWNGDNCRHYRNLGAGDDRPVNGALAVSTNGNTVINGIAFAPQWAEFHAYIIDASNLQVSHTTMIRMSGTPAGFSIAAGATTQRASGISTVFEAIRITDQNGALKGAATVSWNDDGITLNFTGISAGTPIGVRYTFHP